MRLTKISVSQTSPLLTIQFNRLTVFWVPLLPSFFCHDSALCGMSEAGCFSMGLVRKNIQASYFLLA